MPHRPMPHRPGGSDVAAHPTKRRLLAGLLSGLMLAGGWTAAATTAAASAPDVLATPVFSGDEPAGTLYTPREVVIGETITLEGSGFFRADGSGGSAGPIFVNQPSGGTGPVAVENREIENQVPGSTYADARAHGVFLSDGAGDWSITIPFPTPKNSSLTEETAWQAGQTQTLRLLTGSLADGDLVRSVAVSFDIVDEPEPAPEPEPEPEPEPAPEPEARVEVPGVVEPGQDIVISGTGWTDAGADGGSVIGVLLNARFSGDPDTVYTTRDVVNPVTGEVSGDKRLHAIVQADQQGDWTATIPYPTSANARLADGSWTDWTPGSTQQVRILSGSLGPDDVARSLAADITVAGDDPAGPHEPPAWSHVTVTHDSGATAWISQDVADGDDATIRIKGAGWLDRAGTGASTTAIKLNRSESGQYTRTGDQIVEHPSATGDDTIWVLLAPENPGGHPNVIEVGSDGTFDIEFDAPRGLEAGQYLTVLFQSGRFDPGDVTRAVTSGFLTVGGVPHEDGGGSGEQITCVPSTSSPRVHIANPQATVGGTLQVSGTGWCHPDENRGGSVVAIKIDEGAYSRLTDSLHQNRTIWELVEADPATGDWEAEIRLPDGTTSLPDGSDPAFSEGAHSLRLLTGSLKSGDAVRAVLSEEFVVGAYRPNGAPDPLDAATLRASNANGVRAVVDGEDLVVTVPGASRGDWIFLTPYVADGSPRYPWVATWFRADAQGRVTAPLAGLNLPAGPLKLAVQSGNQGRFGELLGWARVTLNAEPGTGAPAGPGASGRQDVSSGPDSSGRGSSTGASLGSIRPAYTLATGAARVVSGPAPTAVPEPPVATSDELTGENAGDLLVTQDGTVVTVTLPSASPGDWVFVYVYSTPVPVGWIQLDVLRQFRLDLEALPAGEHKIAVLDAEGELLGWVRAEIEGADDADAVPRDAVVTPQTTAGQDEIVAAPVLPVPDGGALSADDWWLLGGGALVLLIFISAALVARQRRAAATTGRTA